MTSPFSTVCAPTRRFVFSKPPKGLTRPATSPARTETVPPFRDWLAQVSPSWTWDYPYLRHIQGYLDRVTEGSLRRLMLFLPPRHGKTEMTTIRYPVWRMERDPTLRVIVGAYNQSYASKFGRKTRRLAEMQLELAKDRTAVDDWETAAGGGYRSVGVGGGVTGQGAQLIIIDDPVKSREEAESETYRDRCYDWYRDDLWTRRDTPETPIILIMTRWHEDDLAGRLLDAAQADGEAWKVCNLPALAEEDDPLGRGPGEALCPERFGEEALEAARGVLGGYSFAALYQQRPTAREGNLFKRHWFPTVDAVPALGQRVRWWDKAASDGKGDWTVGVLMARGPDGLFYVQDVVRGQWSSGERNAVMLQVTQDDARTYANRVQTWVEQEPGSGGKESAEASVKLLAGHSVRYERSTGDKTTRADPFAAQCEAGNVRMLKAPWNAAYLDELCSFPVGKHDDQVDASSGAFNKLATATVPGRAVTGGARMTIRQYQPR